MPGNDRIPSFMLPAEQWRLVLEGPIAWTTYARSRKNIDTRPRVQYLTRKELVELARLLLKENAAQFGNEIQRAAQPQKSPQTSYTLTAWILQQRVELILNNRQKLAPAREAAFLRVFDHLQKLQRRVYDQGNLKQHIHLSID